MTDRDNKDGDHGGFSAYLLELRWVYSDAAAPSLCAEIVSVSHLFYSEIPDVKAKRSSATPGKVRRLRQLVAQLSNRGGGHGYPGFGQAAPSGSGSAGDGDGAQDGDLDLADLRQRLRELSSDDDVMSNITDEEQILDELAACLAEDEAEDLNLGIGSCGGHRDGGEDLEWQQEAEEVDDIFRQAEDRLLGQAGFFYTHTL